MKRPMNRISILLLTVLCASSAQATTWPQDQAKTAPSNQIERDPARQSREGAITGHVIGPDGQSMANARVFAYRIGENSGSPHSATVDDDGSFKLTGLPPGIYNVSARALGYISAEAPGEYAIHRIGENMTIAMIKGGVITGRVTDEAGEPIVGVGVRLIRLSYPESRTAGPREDTFEYHFGMTDDRGVYRVFGLLPGAYIANIGNVNSWDDSQISRDSPTYYPSATRDTAAEINLRGDEEVSGVDIRHRGDRGHIVSGSVSGEFASSSSNAVLVSLNDLHDGRDEAYASTSTTRGFAFYGVPDGDYELVATLLDNSDETSGSARRRVSVKGADANGVELKLAPNGSISGRVIIEPYTTPGRCAIKDEPAENLIAGQTREQTGRRPAVEEILLIVNPDDSDQRAQTSRFGRRDGDDGPPNKKGEFAFGDLEAGRYRITANLPDDSWRIRAITRAVAGTLKRSGGAEAKSPVEVSRDGVTIKSGEKLSGVEVFIAQDAASFNGRVVPANERSGFPSRLRAFLIPAEAASANDVIRYDETDVRADGSFEFKHVAPGKYLLHARQFDEKEPSVGQSGPLAWDTIERVKLRREATAAKNEIELKACERVKEHVLQWPMQ